MAQSLNKVWIHAVWSTKDYRSLIKPMIEKDVHQFIIEEFKVQGSPVRAVNGMPDHVHCLFFQNLQRSISEVIKNVKGHSSHMINQQDLLTEKFSWQPGYAAFSVSESNVEKVVQYIKNQKSRHQRQTYHDELNSFFNN